MSSRRSVSRSVSVAPSQASQISHEKTIDEEEEDVTIVPRRKSHDGTILEDVAEEEDDTDTDADTVVHHMEVDVDVDEEEDQSLIDEQLINEA